MKTLPVLVASILLTAARAQTIDDSLLTQIFGTPQSSDFSTSSPDRQNLEDITVKPTSSNSVFTDPDGDSCKCVPYYLCDSRSGMIVNDVESTGWGVLDQRFGGETCQESVEVCCKSPRPEDAPPVTPPPRPLSGCGLRNPKGLDFTLAGGSGREAQFGEFPWVVALLDASNNSYSGVGVLIHPSVVMTAAHVVYKKNSPGALKIRAGEWDTQTVKERLVHQTRTVQEVVIHEGFRPKNLHNDMALLRLDEPVQLAEHVNTLCLPSQDESFEGSRDCVANGWGKDVFGLKGRYAVILKKVELDMVEHERCNRLLQQTRLGHRFSLDRSFVCAGGEEGKDTCLGDGGAALACPVGENSYKLAGLVAWGIGCGQKDVPSVYVNVPAFRQWIDDKMASWGMQA